MILLMPLLVAHESTFDCCTARAVAATKARDWLNPNGLSHQRVAGSEVNPQPVPGCNDLLGSGGGVGPQDWTFSNDYRL